MAILKKNLSNVNKIFEGNCASVRSWHEDPLPFWGQHFTLCCLTQGQARQPSLCVHSPTCPFLLAMVLTLGSIFLPRQVSTDFWGTGSSLSLVEHHLSLPKLQLKILLMSLPAVLQSTHHGCSIFTTGLLPQ